MKKITIIGGGLAGLFSSILLCRAGFQVSVIEKKTYPFHRVCGEYISNEVLPFLRALDIPIDELGPSRISRLAVSAVSGSLFESPLSLGGFGISRFVLDEYLYKLALAQGVKFVLGNSATDIIFHDSAFSVTLLSGERLSSDLVIATHGKRSNIDQKLNRDFFTIRSPYIGVKYHIQTDFPINLIQLDNFEGGYCGINKIEQDKYCLCYLAENRLLKQHGSIEQMEKNVLFKNPFLRRQFEQANFIYPKPEVINQISFAQKTLVENHVLFCGDAAGMITPLCGNGMAMAIHSAKILAEIIKQNAQDNSMNTRTKIEKQWQQSWQAQFGWRLRSGRMIQKLFGSNVVSNLAIASLRAFPVLGQRLIRKTHGKPF